MYLVVDFTLLAICSGVSKTTASIEFVFPEELICLGECLSSRGCFITKNSFDLVNPLFSALVNKPIKCQLFLALGGPV